MARYPPGCSRRPGVACRRYTRLTAANRGLTAAGGLTAANTRLTAANRRLTAANRRLTAANGGLTAANGGLTAANRGLTAAGGLTAANEGHGTEQGGDAGIARIEKSLGDQQPQQCDGVGGQRARRRAGYEGTDVGTRGPIARHG
jgi:hypothetical protein